MLVLASNSPRRRQLLGLGNWKFQVIVSDIGNYLYCRRSWWYRKNGTPSENQAELFAGTELHKKHGRQVLASLLTRTVGLILFLAAILLLVAYCTAQVI